MRDFLKWLSNNPAVRTLLIIAIISVLILIVILYVGGFIQGREISFWPPKIGSQPEPKAAQKNKASRVNKPPRVRKIVENSGGTKTFPDELTIYPVPPNNTLAPGYDMGVNSSGGQTNWLTNMNGYMKMSYPSNQSWGAVFVTVGKPVQPPRPIKDLSYYKYLSVALKGGNGGESVSVGVKDNTDPDDGTETKFKIDNLTTDWQTYTFKLEDFKTAELKNLYVVSEFVFEDSQAKIVYFKNIKYTVNPLTPPLSNKANVIESGAEVIDYVKRTPVPNWQDMGVNTWEEAVENLQAIYWYTGDDDDSIGKIILAVYGEQQIIRVIGWRVRQLDQGWLVSYTWIGKTTKPGEVAGYFWKVTPDGTVTSVNGNLELEKKYRIRWDSHEQKGLSEVYKKNS